MYCSAGGPGITMQKIVGCFREGERCVLWRFCCGFPPQAFPADGSRKGRPKKCCLALKNVSHQPDHDAASSDESRTCGEERFSSGPDKPSTDIERLLKNGIQFCTGVFA